jgi:PilZ domain
MNEVQRRIFSTKPENTTASTPDRRREPRSRMARPVYVRPAAPDGDGFEEVRTMRDFSRGGFYFTTERASYSPGMRLHVIPASGCFNLEYLGVILRVEPLQAGEYGVAVRLLRLESFRSAPDTLALSAFQTFASTECPPPALLQDATNL